MTTPTCHPDRRHLALGLCASCYQVRYKQARHPVPRMRQGPATYVIWLPAT